jgi:methyl-accepting chemotaxis protein
MDDGFELTNEHIDNLEKSMIAQFKGVNEQFQGVNECIDNLEANMNKQLAEQKEDISHLTQLVTKIDANTAELTKVVLKIATKVL